MFRVLLYLALAGAAAAATTIAPDDAQLQFIGRFADGPAGTKLFDMPGCEIRARVVLASPSAVHVLLAQRHLAPPPGTGNTKNSGFEPNAFVVWVDGVRQGAGGHNATFTTNANQSDGKAYAFALTAKPMAAGTHDVRILKATEADWNGGSPVPNYMLFSGLKVAADAALAATTPPPLLPARKIEFLGDSITAGFCNECIQNAPGGSHPNRHLPDDHNEAYGATWDFQIGELLKTQVHTAAWSGLGMVRNCCGGNTTMPTIWNRTLATLNVNDTWQFDSWKADALVINLGTNDGSAATDPEYNYEGIYADVVMQASRVYPGVHVFLACGPMSETYCTPIMNVIKAVTAKGFKNAHFLDQRGFLNGTFGPKCCGHPSIEVDGAMAKSGAAFIAKTLGWK